VLRARAGLKPGTIGWGVLKMRLIIFILAMLQTCVAYGASFDCAKAKSKLEKMICSDPALDKADTQMGESYKNAIKKFPIPGFIQATQKIFLNGFNDCEDVTSCKDMLNSRITVLDDYANAKIYARSKNKYTPEDVVITISGSGNNIILRYFGSWMPDAYKPKPFPDGFICNDEAKLVSKNGQLVADNSDFTTLKITEDKIIMDVMCNPRTSINGEFVRIKL